MFSHLVIFSRYLDIYATVQKFGVVFLYLFFYFYAHQGCIYVFKYTAKL